MKSILSLLFATAFLIGCNTPKTESAKTDDAKPPVDSLFSDFVAAWNAHDSAKVISMYDADALVVDDAVVAENLSEISEKWIHPNINVVNKLNTKKLKEWSCNDQAGLTSRYDFDAVVNDSIVAHPNGVITINWTKSDGAWKINTTHIHGIEEKK